MKAVIFAQPFVARGAVLIVDVQVEGHDAQRVKVRGRDQVEVIGGQHIRTANDSSSAEGDDRQPGLDLLS